MRAVKRVARERGCENYNVLKVKDCELLGLIKKFCLLMSE